MWGRRFFRVTRCTPAPPIEASPFFNDQLRRPDIAPYPTRCKYIDTPAAFDVAGHGTVNLHLSSRDVGVDGGAFTHNQDIGSLDGAVDVPVDPKRT